MALAATIAPSPLISIIVCTRNRATLLNDLLETATRLRLTTPVDWELIVVDNGSTDATAQIVERYADRLPIRRVEEARIGLSHARNRGVSAARGRYFCWTDDDVRLDPAWLAAYAAAFERHPDAAVFGGPILPDIEAPMPRWFRRCSHCWPLTSVMAARDLGEEEFEFTCLPNARPYGANFAVRADEQRRFSYDSRLGAAGDRGLLAEESQLIYSVLSDGASGWWVPGSRVYHRIQRNRQTRRHVLAYFMRFGETAAHLHDHAPGDNCFEVNGRPRFAGRSTAMLLLRMAARLALVAVEALRGRACASLGQWAIFGEELGVVRYRRRARGEAVRSGGRQ
jgi:glycosyltransferase involved in cell wall biosynthesis